MNMNFIAIVISADPKEVIDPVKLMIYTIGWTCVGVFFVTAIAACIAIFRPDKIPDPNVRSWLFKSLVVETSAICLAAFSGLLNPGPLKSDALEGIRRANEKAIEVVEASQNTNVTQAVREERPLPPSEESAIDEL